MSSGEFLTRSTVWVVILAYTVGSIAFAISRGRVEFDRRTREVWTAACVALVAHFICAFNFYHAWSHEAAYVETTRQTTEVFKINWGGGLFINYALLLFWITDVAWWWVAGIASYRRRPWSLVLIWHGFLIFIIFNATVVFKNGLTRWIGLLVSLTLILSWFSINRQRSHELISG